MQTIASPPLKGGRGDVLFEGSPRAGAAEYMHLLIIRYAKVIKKYQSAKKRDYPFLGQSRLLKNIDELITLNYFVEVSFKHPNVLFLTRDEVAH